MSAPAKNPVKSSDARAKSIASFVAAMGEPRKVAPKKEAVVVVDDDDADDTFAAFAEREKKKIMDLGIEPDESYLNAEINRRWEMRGRGKSVALKAKAASKGSVTPASKAVNVESAPEKRTAALKKTEIDRHFLDGNGALLDGLIMRRFDEQAKRKKSEGQKAKADEEEDESVEASMHMIDTKLDAATAKTMGVVFAGEIKGRFLYKNVEVKEAKQLINKVKESKAELAKPSALPAAKPKPSPSPSKAASSGGSSKKRKSDNYAAKSEKKKAKDEEVVDLDHLAQTAEHWTQVAAGRLMIKCAHHPEARVHIQGLLNVFGVELDAKILSSKTVSLTEVSELARQMHYETDTDNGEDDEEEEAPH